MDDMDVDVPVPPEPYAFKDLPLQYVPKTEFGILQERICMSGMVEITAKADGNCMFNCLAMQVYKDEKYSKFVRRQICEELERNKWTYVFHSTSEESGLPSNEEYDTWVTNMKEDGTYGNMTTLTAAANIYQARIILITSFPGVVMQQITPYDMYRKDLFLSYYYKDRIDCHVNPIVPLKELPPNVPANERRPSHPKYKWKKKEKAHVVDDVYSIHVDRLQPHVTKIELLEEFEQYGDVADAEVMLDNDGVSLEHGIVKMRNSFEFVKAILNLNGKFLQGEPMLVKAAKIDVNPHLANLFEASFA